MRIVPPLFSVEFLKISTFKRGYSQRPIKSDVAVTSHWGRHLLMSMWWWRRSYIHTLLEKFILLSTNRADISFHGMILLLRSSHGSGGKWRHRFDDLGVHCKRYSWSGKEDVWSNELFPFNVLIIHWSYIRKRVVFSFVWSFGFSFFTRWLFKTGVFCYFSPVYNFLFIISFKEVKCLVKYCFWSGGWGREWGREKWKGLKIVPWVE